MYSIRRHLVLLLISVLTCISFKAALQGYKNSMGKASSLFDTELQLLASAILKQPLGRSEAQIQPSNGEFAFQLWQQNQLQAATSDISHRQKAEFEPGFSEANFAGQRWRILNQSTLEPQLTVVVAQPLASRFQIAEQIILTAVTPIIFAIPLFLLLIYWIIGRGLAPLKSLSRQLEKKAPGDLQQITLSHSPAELSPVLHTINSLLGRLNNAFLREQRFAADAAHELRTPLSLLKVANHNLRHAQDSHSLESLEQGIDRMSHVVNQILLLNRTAPELVVANFTRQDIKHLCQQAVAQQYDFIQQKQQQIELQADGEHFDLTGNEFALLTLLLNLISNACKYTPQAGKIYITLKQQQQLFILTIEDSGPGISEEEQAQIFERFYRVGRDRHDSKAKGCGLGLSIVKQIAELHQADIRLSASTTLGGLCVEVRFTPHNQDTP